MMHGHTIVKCDLIIKVPSYTNCSC